MSFLQHYGVGHDKGGHSGRYPWGSGQNPFQDHIENYTGIKSFLDYMREMESKGLSRSEIAEGLGMSQSRLKQYYSIAIEEEKRSLVERAEKLYFDNNKNASAAAREMGVPDTTFRDYLKAAEKSKYKIINDKADELKEALKTKKYIDVGLGAARQLGITDTKLESVLRKLQLEGYEVYSDMKLSDRTTNKRLTMKILAPPGTSKYDIYQNLSEIKSLVDYETVEQFTNEGLKTPVGIDRSRVYVRYAEDGGADKDGTIELKRGVEDLSLGKDHFSQVRIQVDDDKFMKGMAFYSDDPIFNQGYDIIYNSNKPKGTPDIGGVGDTVFKGLKEDKDNPFGSAVLPSRRNNETGLLEGGQHEYVDQNGKVKLSSINKLSEEGNWDDWKLSASSQILAKQPVKLIKSQLEYSIGEREAQLAQINEITQPTLRKLKLVEFGDDCDKMAAYLKAESFPGQSTKVLLPINSLKPGEIYAPSYENGQQLALFRHPHAGTFEIAVLTVNNKNKEGQNVITPNGLDAVGIRHDAAVQLSGADFDGDTAVVIPLSDKVKINHRTMPEELTNFSTNDYKIDRSVVSEKQLPRMDKKYQQTYMGIVTNLITDMTQKGAELEDIITVDKHSMVVIDAYKHDLDWRQSAKDSHIKEYQAIWQKNDETGKAGASTIFSRAKSPTKIDEVRTTRINKETGELENVYSNRTIRRAVFEYQKDDKGHYVKDAAGRKIKVYQLDENGKRIYEDTGEKATQETYRMNTVKDAYELTSGGSREKTTNPKEILYADYANSLKALANKARLESTRVKDDTYDKEAASQYAKEVASIDNKLAKAELSAPRERQVRITSNVIINDKIANNPELTKDKDKLKRVRNSVLTAQRSNFGAKKETIDLSEAEWLAIQAGAVKKSTVEKVYRNSNKDRINELLKESSGYKTSITPSLVMNIKNKKSNGNYTTAEIAKALGISESTVTKVLKGDYKL